MTSSPSCPGNCCRHLPEVSHAALSALLDDWLRDDHPFHLLALLPDAERAAVPLLQTACNERGITLAGGVFPALIEKDRFVTQGVQLLRVVDAPQALLLTGVGAGSAPAAVAEELLEHVLSRLSDDEDATLFCIFDALTPNIATHLDQWYLKLADRVRYLGVNAGNERFEPAPCLFDNQRFVGDALLVQLLPGHPGGRLEHAYGVPEQVISATSARGNRIVQIDWQPALQVYQRILAEAYGVVVNRENFYQYAVHFPFGILRADGEILVRIPVALDVTDAIVCVGEIPENSVLTLLDARDGIGRAVTALQTAAPVPGSGQLLFYCAGRRMHAGPLAEEELQAFAASTGSLCGALSLGEIGGSRSGGYPLFHNATLVDVPWPGR
ncbi:FIST C-terminal domain-containing protein [Dechloromonas sp. ZY10]|uniref:FIST signal transduction protein n=1 Tax=Dechloromonas aquae TaxID=2664436 RepID=UPI003526E8AF